MKRAICWVLTALAVAGLASCAERQRQPDADALFGTVCSADDGLAMAKGADAVVIEGMCLTAGGEVWDAFYEKVSRGSPASVLCARYYTLDRERVSEELYEQEKNDDPKLFFYRLDYDGTAYTVKIRQSTEREPETEDAYRCLLHFTGSTPPTALWRKYDYYVLTDDPDVTWEDIEAGMFSSQLGAWIRHCAVYQNQYD